MPSREAIHTWQLAGLKSLLQSFTVIFGLVCQPPKDPVQWSGGLQYGRSGKGMGHATIGADWVCVSAASGDNKH